MKIEQMLADFLISTEASDLPERAMDLVAAPMTEPAVEASLDIIERLRAAPSVAELLAAIC